MNVWDCEFYARCKNNSDCLKCGPEQRLLSLPEDKRRKQYESKAKNKAITAVDDNSGSTLEEYVRDRLNAVPTVKEYEGMRQAGSGNIWFMPGDVKDTVLLVECKERLTLTTQGKKTMSIPMSMLQKIFDEAKTYGTYPAFCFRYKGDMSGKTYIVNDFDVLCEMVHEIKLLRHEWENIKQERNEWKALAEQQQREIERLKKLLKKKG